MNINNNKIKVIIIKTNNLYNNYNKKSKIFNNRLKIIIKYNNKVKKKQKQNYKKI